MNDTVKAGTPVPARRSYRRRMPIGYVIASALRAQAYAMEMDKEGDVRDQDEADKIEAAFMAGFKERHTINWKDTSK